VLIVPICGEQVDCLRQLTHNIQAERFLIIACLNRPNKHAKSNQWQQQNKQLITRLYQQARSIESLNQGCFFTFEHHDIWLIDFNEKPFDANQGVGLARKIAADSALQLIDKQVVKSHWIHSTDADVILPADYFEVACDSDYTAYSLPFRHISEDKELNHWQALYDFKLRYYQQGMRYIGTVYNYIPLGSCLIIQADDYAKVRGFPIRSGGEDFYLLNKLAKVGKIAQPSHPVIEINARLSQRVPFGTGPGLLKIKESKEPARFYHPQIFVEIKAWLQQLSDYYESRQLPSHADINQFWNTEQVIQKALRQTKSPERWQQFVLEWFDAFKILKTVHALEFIYPRLDMGQLKEIDVFCELTESLLIPE
ncbi:MAG: hypothetical protein OQK49_08540, partial [Proteobacteria bacterium]|nr:hypothetical protein [Pseudomonadota bacterium]